MEFLKQVAFFIIKNEIELIVVSERLPQIDDVRMPILRKHLDLSTDRLLCVLVACLRFFESFDRYEGSSLPMLRFEYLSVGSFTD